MSEKLSFDQARWLVVEIEQRAISDGRKKDAESANKIVNWFDSANNKVVSWFDSE